MQLKVQLTALRWQMSLQSPIARGSQCNVVIVAALLAVVTDLQSPITGEGQCNQNMIYLAVPYHRRKPLQRDPLETVFALLLRLHPPGRLGPQRGAFPCSPLDMGEIRSTRWVDLARA